MVLLSYHGFPVWQSLALTLLGLSAFGVEATQGLAYAVVLHAVAYLPQVVLGGIALALFKR